MEKFQNLIKSEKNIHDGHRIRLLQLVKKSGLENVSDIQAMEFILTYIFPRGDVNPLAHRLLDRFGSVANVLDADVSDLQSIKGIGKRGADLLTAIPDIFQLYMMCRISKKELLSSKSAIYDFCEILVRMKKNEELYIVGLDARYRHLGHRCLAKGTLTMVGVNQNEITKFLNSVNPVFVFILHNHPGGVALASAQDVKATINMQTMFNTLSINFLDHYIVGTNGIYSICNARMEREFIEL